jgi:hypothetical protein
VGAEAEWIVPARNSFNETVSLKGENHLVHRWRAHAEVFFHIGLGRGSAIDPAVVVDEREIMTLLMREGFDERRGSTLSDEAGHRLPATALLAACRSEFVSIQPSWVPQVSILRLGISGL